jgi:hypothetical protein
MWEFVLGEWLKGWCIVDVPYAADPPKVERNS